MERFFKLKERGSDISTEVIAGTTTFMTMSYIVFVQPVILLAAGMDFGAVMTATCVASALATILMGLLTNYPIAQAPAMGHNAFFAFVVCGAMGYSWQVALGAVFISGSILVVLSLFGVWGALVKAVPGSIKHSIAVGIGLLIAMIGLQWAGIVADSPATLVTLGDLKDPAPLLSLFGVTVIAILMAWRIRGAILWGILVCALAGLPLGMVEYQGIVAMPPSLAPTFLQLDIMGALSSGLISVVFVFFFLDLFDTVGTLIGVADQAGYIVDGELPQANRAVMADAVGTVTGALLGTSTVTSYIESAAGISEGGRTGLANIVTGCLFLLALFFSPLAKMIGGGFEVGDGRFLYPVVAPALIIVGCLMVRGVTKIAWDDVTEAIPAFLTMIMMPLTFSITDGLAFGFISCAILNLASGRGRQLHWIMYLCAGLLALRYLFL